MKDYCFPEITVIGDSMEGVYAASGFVPGEPPITPIPVIPSTPEGDWRITCEFRNHNSGSHSEVAIIAKNNGTKSGECLIMHIGLTGNKFLKAVPDTSGYSVSNVSPTGFTITRNGHFNPNERVEFNIQVTTDQSDSKGSFGTTGIEMQCPFFCYGYTAG